MREVYYIPFYPEANINYFYLFTLYDLAKYSSDTKLYDTIRWSKQDQIAKQLSISSATFSRIINAKSNSSYYDYNKFMSISKEDKVITLKCNVIDKKNNKFVRLTSKEIAMIRHQNDNLFAKYFIYLKYYCVLTKNNTDFTQEQFLQAIGYCDKSNNQKSLLTNYNNYLVSNGYITIQHYTDDKGHLRNRYFFIGI